MNGKGQEGGNEERKELGQYMKVSYKGSLIASSQCELHFRNSQFIGHCLQIPVFLVLSESI